ncbi:MAG: type 4a pilus biogenesis protein PilO [Candidatus Omnitrophota bacterium]
MISLESIIKKIPKLELDDAKRKILILYGLIFLVVLALYIFVFLIPSFSKIFIIIPKARMLAENINSVTVDLKYKEALKSKAMNLDEKMSTYATKLSREKELPKLLESLSKIAKSSRVKILSITPLSAARLNKIFPEETKAVYSEIPIAISAISGYHDLGIFINKLENDERYMEVSDIKIKSSRTNPKRHDIQFVVYAYTVG